MNKRCFEDYKELPDKHFKINNTDKYLCSTKCLYKHFETRENLTSSEVLIYDDGQYRKLKNGDVEDRLRHIDQY